MNRLRYESSPYLLQHAHNPVDWYPWGDEALQLAKTTDRPILVSIGYSTCHWCHVMERESFEDETTAAYMNAHFVCIKVDREERPDLDQIYMEACQIMTGQGGWPLNCFLLPDGRPFFAGTYYPPQPAYQRPSWMQVLQNIQRAYTTDYASVAGQAAQLTEIIAGSGTALLERAGTATTKGAVSSSQAFEYLKDRFDTDNGGFGGAPKFPNTLALQFLLEYYFFSGNEAAKTHGLFSLDRMIAGGIYDQLRGGFSRYTVDAHWNVPHFEKMLYDNALIVHLLCDAYALTQAPHYERAIRETLDWVADEMTAVEGGFYSALDADSEGVEGKFYVWQKSEIDALLGEEAALFNAYYGVTEGGNWEGTNILYVPTLWAAFAETHELEEEKLRRHLERNRQTLLAARAKRVRPGLDNKRLLDWNALMVRAYARAAGVLDDADYREVAETQLDYLLAYAKTTDGDALAHLIGKSTADASAFLTDYAYLIAALLDVHAVVQRPDYLTEAQRWTDFLLTHFQDPVDGLFYFTDGQNESVIVRRKELYDQAVPGGNSTMVLNLQRLGHLVDRADYRAHAERMLQGVEAAAIQHPLGLAQWNTGLLRTAYGYREIVVVGAADGETQPLHTGLLQHYLPGSVLVVGEGGAANPLLADKPAGKSASIYVCRNFSCQAPVEDVESAVRLAGGRR